MGYCPSYHHYYYDYYYYYYYYYCYCYYYYYYYRYRYYYYNYSRVILLLPFVVCLSPVVYGVVVVSSMPLRMLLRSITAFTVYVSWCLLSAAASTARLILYIGAHVDSSLETPHMVSAAVYPMSFEVP